MVIRAKFPGNVTYRFNICRDPTVVPSLSIYAEENGLHESGTIPNVRSPPSIASASIVYQSIISERLTVTKHTTSVALSGAS